MFNRFKNILFNIATIIAVLIIVAGLLCMICGIRADVVLSGSMEPEMGTGSLAFTNTKDKDVEVGDIIHFRSGTASVSHRVVEITEDGYVTKGDNNENQDFKIVTDEMIVGTVFFWIPKLGYVVKWLISPTGLIILVTFLICMYLLSKLPGKKEKAQEENISDEEMDSKIPNLGE